MSIFESNKTAHQNIFKQIKGESPRDYQMFLDYCKHRDLNKLTQKYKIQIRQLFNIKEKNEWKKRIFVLESKASEAFLAENYSTIFNNNNQKRENLLKQLFDLQDRMVRFMFEVSNAPYSKEDDYQPTQLELIKIYRYQTKTLLEMYKLEQILEDKLKKFNLDLSPESLSNFEQKVILGEEMLNYFDDYNPVAELVEAPEYHTNTMASAGGGASLLAEGVCEPKQNVTPQIPTENPDTEQFLPIKGDVSLLTEGIKKLEINPTPLTQEEIDLEKEIELGYKEIQENLKQINENFKTMPYINHPILTNHNNKANSKLVKKIKSLSK